MIPPVTSLLVALQMNWAMNYSMDEKYNSNLDQVVPAQAVLFFQYSGKNNFQFFFLKS